MNKLSKFIVVAVVVSAASLSVSLWVLWLQFKEGNVPEGVLEVELPKKDTIRVTLDSKWYEFTMTFFLREYATSAQVKVQTSSGSQIRKIYLGKVTVFYDLKVTFKETKANSIVIWIEKQ